MFLSDPIGIKLSLIKVWNYPNQPNSVRTQYTTSNKPIKDVMIVDPYNFFSFFNEIHVV